jgi:hypothetical protein
MVVKRKSADIEIFRNFLEIAAAVFILSNLIERITINAYVSYDTIWGLHNHVLFRV